MDSASVFGYGKGGNFGFCDHQKMGAAARPLTGNSWASGRRSHGTASSSMLRGGEEQLWEERRENGHGQMGI